MKFATWLDGLTEDTTPDTANDMLAEFDDSATVMKKLKLETLIALANASGIGANGWVAADAMTYASADDPTYTMTCTGDQSTKYYPGMRIKLTQATGGTKYFIITKVAYSSSTTLTLYGGTDYNLENEAITSPYYSCVKAPAGFPLDPTKWQVVVSDTTNRDQASPVLNTWYNIGSITISIPIGAWVVSWHAAISAYKATETTLCVHATLSTANNSESDTEFTARLLDYNTRYITASVMRSKYLTLASKTSYYLNFAMISTSGATNIDLENGSVPAVIQAVCAYL